MKKRKMPKLITAACTASDASIELNGTDWKARFLSRYQLLGVTTASPEAASACPPSSDDQASRLEREGKVFSVIHEGRKGYPAFQFTNGLPLPVIELLITRFSDYFAGHFEGWDLTLFLCQSSGYLRGSAPIDLLELPGGDQQVLMAAKAYLGTGGEP